MEFMREIGLLKANKAGNGGVWIKKRILRGFRHIASTFYSKIHSSGYGFM